MRTAAHDPFVSKNHARNLEVDPVSLSMDVIGGIAAQTNLLALDATIEANKRKRRTGAMGSHILDRCDC